MALYIDEIKEVLGASSSDLQKTTEIRAIHGKIQWLYASKDFVAPTDEVFRKMFFDFGLVLKDLHKISDQRVLLEFLPELLHFFTEFCNHPVPYPGHKQLPGYAKVKAAYLTMYEALSRDAKFNELFKGEFY